MLFYLRCAISRSRPSISSTRALPVYLHRYYCLAQSGYIRALYRCRRMAESLARTGGDHRGDDAGDGSGKAETRTVHTTERLVALRALMKDNQVDA